MQQEHLKQGQRCLLVVLDQRFLVSILEAGGETVLVTFPTRGLPMDGMLVHLEFHDKNGYASYETEVVRSPREPGDGLLLKRPSAYQTTSHRLDWRVPADIEAQFKVHAHPRRIKGRVLNMSVGGLLIESRARLSIDDSLDLELTLPGPHRIDTVGQVVFSSPVEDAASGVHRHGVRFVGLEPENQHAIIRYIRNFLRATYPWRFSQDSQ